MQRDTYIGTWLPEPILTDNQTSDAGQHIELHEVAFDGILGPT